ncbi:MAG: chromate efflux transporter [Thermoanaerobaculia bacterium]|nr:chromate efflux transporter [Thermoanaerobaculia bacterium]
MSRSDPRDRMELATLFLRLGATAFGGPAAHISMMEHEVVARRGWMTRGEFLDLLGATNLAPGPASTKMALFIGYARGGWPGFLLAGLGFMLPATFIVTAFAWAYVRFGSLPAFPHFFTGIKPVVLALIVQALVGLGRTAMKSRFLLAMGLAALIAAFFVHEIILLLAAGFVSVGVMVIGDLLRKEEGAAPAQATPQRASAADADAATRSEPRAADALVPPKPPSKKSLFLPLSLPLSLPLLPAALSSSFSLSSLFLFFLKTGAILFGSGYVLLAFLKADLVERWHWLTSEQLLDAVAVGQFTPGPLSSTATFIGYQLGGLPGAAVATLGIFLPAFAIVALMAPFALRLRRSRPLGAFLDGVNVAALALMGSVTLQFARPALTNGPTVALFLAGVAALATIRINAAWLVLAGGLLGVVFG